MHHGEGPQQTSSISRRKGKLSVWPLGRPSQCRGRPVEQCRRVAMGRPRKTTCLNSHEWAKQAGAMAWKSRFQACFKHISRNGEPCKAVLSQLVHHACIPSVRDFEIFESDTGVPQIRAKRCTRRKKASQTRAAMYCGA